VIGDRELLSVWDEAQETHPAMRPVLLLRAAGGPDAAEKLPLPTRDRLLLSLRERWFGRAFESVVSCETCGAAIELTFDGGAIAAVEEAAPASYRLPDTTDLIAISNCATEDEARTRLVERCMVGDASFEDVASALDAVDDLRIAVTCPDCGASWDVVFDPGAYLWHEVDAAAMRVLREVDALASAYGWSEEAILSMSPRRRAVYLRMVTQ
jgi:ribosomal protein S27E